MKKVDVKPFYKKISVPYSKSYLNRALILASLNPEVVTIHGNSDATDVKNLISCLEKIGLEIECSKKYIKIKNSFPACEKATTQIVELNTYDGGTTTRFLLPLLVLGKNSYQVHMAVRMMERPLDEIFRVFKESGVKATKDKNSMTVQGPIHLPENLIVDCAQTTQEASAFLLAFSHNKVQIKTINDSRSKSYLELTYNLLRNKNQKEFFPPRDFSSISYPLALAAVTGEVTILECLAIDPMQADSKFYHLLQQLGFPCVFSEEGLTVKKQEKYSGFTFDCGDCLDLVPTLAFLASYAQSRSHLTHVSNLRFKECDRLKVILEILKVFHVDAHYDERTDELVIEGLGPQVKSKDLDLVDDHRMIMMGYLFLRKNNGGTIKHSEAVNKSFPNFFEMMN